MPLLTALRTPNYAIYASGNAISLIGFWMQRIAVGWLTWELTESGGWLGLVAFADLFPSVFVGPIGGVVADRIDPLKIIAAAQSFAMVQSALLFALVAADLINVYLLILMVFLNGLAMGFNQPSRLAMVPSLVPRALIGNAVAINAIIFNSARFIGPALAGLFIASWGVGIAFAANAATYVPFLLALWVLRRRIKGGLVGGAGKAPGTTLLDDIAEGLRYVAGHAGIGPLLFLLLAISIGVRPFVELMPGFAAQVFDRGAEALAIMTSALGLGSIVSGIWMAKYGGTTGMMRWTFPPSLTASRSQY